MDPYNFNYSSTFFDQSNNLIQNLANNLINIGSTNSIDEQLSNSIDDQLNNIINESPNNLINIGSTNSIEDQLSNSNNQSNRSINNHLNYSIDDQLSNSIDDQLNNLINESPNNLINKSSNNLINIGSTNSIEDQLNNLINSNSNQQKDINNIYNSNLSRDELNNSTNYQSINYDLLNNIQQNNQSQINNLNEFKDVLNEFENDFKNFDDYFRSKKDDLQNLANYYEKSPKIKHSQQLNSDHSSVKFLNIFNELKIKLKSLEKYINQNYNNLDKQKIDKSTQTESINLDQQKIVKSTQTESNIFDSLNDIINEDLSDDFINSFSEEYLNFLSDDTFSDNLISNNLESKNLESKNLESKNLDEHDLKEKELIKKYIEKENKKNKESRIEFKNSITNYINEFIDQNLKCKLNNKINNCDKTNLLNEQNLIESSIEKKLKINQNKDGSTNSLTENSGKINLIDYICNIESKNLNQIPNNANIVRQQPLTSSNSSSNTVINAQQQSISNNQNLKSQTPNSNQQHQIHHLKVEDALNYIDKVKYKFTDQPQMFKDFRNIMEKYTCRSIDIHAVTTYISDLFKGYTELIDGFNKFLEPEHKIKIQADDQVNIMQNKAAKPKVKINKSLDLLVQPNNLIQSSDISETSSSSNNVRTQKQSFNEKLSSTSSTASVNQSNSNINNDIITLDFDDDDNIVSIGNSDEEIKIDNQNLIKSLELKSDLITDAKNMKSIFNDYLNPVEYIRRPIEFDCVLIDKELVERIIELIDQNSIDKAFKQIKKINFITKQIKIKIQDYLKNLQKENQSKNSHVVPLFKGSKLFLTINRLKILSNFQSLEDYISLVLTAICSVEDVYRHSLAGDESICSVEDVYRHSLTGDESKCEDKHKTKAFSKLIINEIYRSIEYYSNLEENTQFYRQIVNNTIDTKLKVLNQFFTNLINNSNLKLTIDKIDFRNYSKFKENTKLFLKLDEKIDDLQFLDRELSDYKTVCRELKEEKINSKQIDDYIEFDFNPNDLKLN